MGALRTKMDQDLLNGGLSPLTHEAYLRTVVGLPQYYEAPDTLSAQDVQAYLAYLIFVHTRLLVLLGICALVDHRQ